jgi:hypothetical protein
MYRHETTHTFVGRTENWLRDFFFDEFQVIPDLWHPHEWGNETILHSVAGEVFSEAGEDALSRPGNEREGIQTKSFIRVLCLFEFEMHRI